MTTQKEIKSFVANNPDLNQAKMLSFWVEGPYDSWATSIDVYKNDATDALLRAKRMLGAGYDISCVVAINTIE